MEMLSNLYIIFVLVLLLEGKFSTRKYFQIISDYILNAIIWILKVIIFKWELAFVTETRADVYLGVFWNTLWTVLSESICFSPLFFSIWLQNYSLFLESWWVYSLSLKTMMLLMAIYVFIDSYIIFVFIQSFNIY